MATNKTTIFFFFIDAKILMYIFLQNNFESSRPLTIFDDQPNWCWEVQIIPVTDHTEDPWLRGGGAHE